MSGLDKLDMLAAQADDGIQAIDNPQAPGEQAQVDQGPNYLQEATIIVDVCTAIVVGMVPKAADVWTQPVKDRVAGALAPVLEKYGFTVGDIPPELGLAVALVPPMIQTYKLYAEVAKAAKDKQKARTFDAEKPPQAEPQAATTAATVADTFAE